MNHEELNEKYGINELLKATITNREEKEALDVVIAQKRGELLKELSESTNAADSQAIHDALYDLKTARYRIQTQLAKIARANIAKRK